jgi:hypothetical protein
LVGNNLLGKSLFDEGTDDELGGWFIEKIVIYMYQWSNTEVVVVGVGSIN